MLDVARGLIGSRPWMGQAGQALRLGPIPDCDQGPPGVRCNHISPTQPRPFRRSLRRCARPSCARTGRRAPYKALSADHLEAFEGAGDRRSDRHRPGRPAPAEAPERCRSERGRRLDRAVPADLGRNASLRQSGSISPYSWPPWPPEESTLNPWPASPNAAPSTGFVVDKAACAMTPFRAQPRPSRKHFKCLETAGVREARTPSAGARRRMVGRRR